MTVYIDVKATLSTSADQDHCNDTTGPALEDPVESLNVKPLRSVLHSTDSILEARLILIAIAPSPGKTWNLKGYDANDRDHNVITPDDWYGFHANMFAKVEQERKECGTNARDIIDKAGGYEEPVEKEQGRKLDVSGYGPSAHAAVDVGLM